MTDQARRNTLKNIAALGVGASGVGASSDVLARFGSCADLHNSKTPSKNPSTIAMSPDEELVKIQVSASVDKKTNDLEVLLTNTSSSSATVSHMTPAEINTARGRFDFQELFNNGELQLAPGESVSVPIQRHAVVLDGSSIQQRVTALTHSLRRNVSIVTNGNAFAATTIVESTALA